MSVIGFPQWRQSQLDQVRREVRSANQGSPGSSGGGVRGWLDFLTGPSALKPSTDKQLMTMLDETIPALRKDIDMDACPETYGPGCAGTDAEADAFLKVLNAKYPPSIGAGGSGGAKQILIDAGVDPTDENVKAFGACVSKSKDLTGAISVPRGTLAKCAIEVKRKGAGPKVHSTKVWRDQYETWQRAFGVWRAGIDASALGLISTNELEAYRAKYNTFRETFLDSGGKTSAPPVNEPALVPTWVWWVGGGIVVVAATGYLLTSVGYVVSSFSGKPA